MKESPAFCGGASRAARWMVPPTPLTMFIASLVLGTGGAKLEEEGATTLLRIDYSGFWTRGFLDVQDFFTAVLDFMNGDYTIADSC